MKQVVCDLSHQQNKFLLCKKKKLYLSKASTSLFPITAYQEKCKELQLL